MAFCPRLRGPEREKLFGHGNNTELLQTGDKKNPRLQIERPVSQNRKSSQEVYSPLAVVRTDPFRKLSIMPKIPEISFRIQMERFVSVSSDRNIRDQL